MIDMGLGKRTDQLRASNLYRNLRAIALRACEIKCRKCHSVTYGPIPLKLCKECSRHVNIHEMR